MFVDYTKHVHRLDSVIISLSWAEWLPGALTWLSAGQHGPAQCAAPLVVSGDRRTALPGPHLLVCFQDTPSAWPEDSQAASDQSTSIKLMLSF